jgi:hypothetical protein
VKPLTNQFYEILYHQHTLVQKECILLLRVSRMFASVNLFSRTATRLRSASMTLVYNKLVCLSELNTISAQQVSTCLCAHMQLSYGLGRTLNLCFFADGHSVGVGWTETL